MMIVEMITTPAGITESMSVEAEKREILFTNQRGGFFPPYILDLHI